MDAFEPKPTATDKFDGQHNNELESVHMGQTSHTDRSTLKNFKFWAVIAGLSVVGVLPALEGTVVSTALPSIIADLDGGDLYVWVVNAYFLTTTAFQPLYGQLSDIAGRKILVLSAIILFMAGSAISGAAKTMTVLIAGRAIQGIGGGGVSMMIEIVVSDMLSVRERGTYLGIIMGACTLGTAAGPIFGGLFVQYTTWRWVFFLNLPVGGVALILLGIFFTPRPRPAIRFQDFLRIDFLGNTLLIMAMVSILLALSYGGSQYKWSSVPVVVPLVMGLVGLIAWLSFEVSPLCSIPTVSKRMFANRTTSATLAITFFFSLMLTWTGYFLPIYFQSVLQSTPARSGVQLLPALLCIMFGGLLGGTSIQITGRYRPFHMGSLVLITVSIGLFSLLTSSSSDGAWIGYQIMYGIGAGVLISTLLQPAQAALPESDVAAVTGFWAFLRSFGQIWGIAIPAAVFSNRTTYLAESISDATVRTKLQAGNAYQFATQAFVGSLQDRPDVQGQVIEIFTMSIRTVWQVALAFCILAFLFTFVEREVPLRKDLDTEYGLANEERSRAGNGQNATCKNEVASCVEEKQEKIQG